MTVAERTRSAAVAIVCLALSMAWFGGVAQAAGTVNPPGEPVVPGSAEAPPAASGAGGLGGFQPLTPWRKPPLALPSPPVLGYRSLAEAGVRQAAHWAHHGWYCEYLRCTHGPYPLLTLWGEVPMFQSADALEIASPSPAHLALLRRFARLNQRYWDRAVGGYAPYAGDRAGNVQTFFDDNGWEGLAFLNAYKATRELRWLHDAQRAFRFIAARGWDHNGGGMWWNTSHPYHSGPALAAGSLLGILLYGEDHEAWQLNDVKTYIDWANTEDNHDERQFYLSNPSQPESVADYVQAPLVYAQYLLCHEGAGESYCVRAGRVAATLAEQHVDQYGYEYNYGPEYDAIFMQWMMAYGRASGQSYWLTLAEVNAAAAASNVAARPGPWLSSWWGGRIADPETHSNMFRTMAATTSLFAWVDLYAS